MRRFFARAVSISFRPIAQAAPRRGLSRTVAQTQKSRLFLFAGSTSLILASAATLGSNSDALIDVKNLIAKLSHPTATGDSQSAGEALKELAMDNPSVLVKDIPALVKCIAPNQPEAVQMAALDVLAVACSNENIADAVVNAGAIASLIAILKSALTTPNATSVHPGTDSASSILLSIVNSRPTSKSAGRVLKEACGVLVDVMGVVNGQVCNETRVNCAQILSQLSANEGNQNSILKSNANFFKVLDLTMKEEELLHAACSIITNFITGSNASKIPRDVAIQAIELPLRTDNLETQLNLTKAMSSILASPKAASFPWCNEIILTFTAMLLAEQQKPSLCLALLEGLEGALHHARLVRIAASSPTFEQVIESIGSTDKAQAHTALKIINKITMSLDTAADRFVVANGVRQIVKAAAVHKKDPAMRDAIAHSLNILSKHAFNEKILLAQTSVPILLGLLHVRSVESQRAATTAIANMSSEAFNKYLLPRASVMQELIDLLKRTSDVQVVRQACRSLGHLTATQLVLYFGDSTLEIFNTSGGLKTLSNLMLSSDPIIHRNSTWIISNMSLFSGNHEKMGPVIDYLLKVLAGGTLEAKRYAVVAISNLATTDKTRDYLNKRNTLRQLNAVLQAHHGDRFMLQFTNIAIANLARNGTQIAAAPAPDGEDGTFA